MDYAVSMRLFVRRFPALLCLLAALSAAAPPANKAGLDPARLARIPERMRDFVHRGDIAGAVMLVARHGTVALLDSAGYQDLENKKPMANGSIFQIMSMTKPVTGIGIMMLYEEGRVELNAPVERYLPEFRGAMLAGGMNASPITVRDLMTHTAGVFDPEPDDIMPMMDQMRMTLAGAVRVYAKQPLLFERNTKWQYSSPGIGILGRIIEVQSGQSFEQFIQERLLTPLGMKDTFYYAPEDKRGRVAMVYRKQDGKLARAHEHLLGGDPEKFRPGSRYPAPEWGMYSTASDLYAVYQMMLNGGTYNGRRYLSKPAIELMTQLHTAHIPNAGWIGGGGYGLTWEVVKDAPGTYQLHSPGTFGHGGAFGTQGWIDPKRDLIRVFMVQNEDSGADEASKAFMVMAAGAIVD